MGGEAERRGAARLGEQQRWTVEMLVPRRARPDRRQWHEMRQTQRVDQRLADIGIDMPGQAAEPGLDGVDGPADGGEAVRVDDAPDRAALPTSPVTAPVHARAGGGQTAAGN